MEEKQARYLDPTDWNIGPCWQVRRCPDEWRATCPAWQYEAGYSCWEVNTTRCQGKLYKNRREKKKLCYQCEIFQSILVKPKK